MQSLSKKEIKEIAQLKQSKYRHENKQFIVEGEKMVREAIESHFNVVSFIATSNWYKKNEATLQLPMSKCFETSIDGIKRISSMVTPQEVLAVIQIPQYVFDIQLLKNKLSIVLENIQEPGNLGTIIRTADWFGIEHVICSNGSVDCFNPKVVQSTMGAIFRVKVIYTDLLEFIDEAKHNGIEIIGSYLNGSNIYQFHFPQSCLIVMGNESKGISKELSKSISTKITIPGFKRHENGTESLNVAMATSIICSEWYSRNYRS